MRVRYLPGFVPMDEAEDLFRTLRSESFEQHEIVLFGRRVAEPRLIAWAGDVPYRYSGKTLPPRALSPLLRRLLERINTELEELARAPANHVLMNYYRDGRDSMGLHADDEPELGPDPIVVSLSLGAERRFRFVPRDKADPGASLELASGSLLVMAGACQSRYRHELPKVQGLELPRLNLTFRRILRPPR